jgi:predicted transcriptional regulator
MSSFLDNYSLAEPTIRRLYDSRLRLAILDALKEGPMRLADLRRQVNANAPNTSSKAKELEGMGLVERLEGDFSLTPYGKAVRNRAQESFEFYATYEKFKGFWNKQRTDGIPQELWFRIGELNNSQLMQNIPSNVTAAHDSFVLLLNSIKTKFYGVSPIFHEEYLHATLLMLRKQVDTQLILNPEIFRVMANMPKKLKTELRELCKNAKWYLYDKELRVAFTVSESFLSLALEPKDNSMHYMNKDLQSTDPRAVSWGLDLFEHYKKQSTPVKLSDYL